MIQVTGKIMKDLNSLLIVPNTYYKIMLVLSMLRGKKQVLSSSMYAQEDIII